MNSIQRYPWLSVLAIAIFAFVVIAGGFGIYLASVSGDLPWQEDPTRIPIEPFADIPGFTAPTPTPAP